MEELSALMAGLDGFDWDEHNSTKIRSKHGVQPQECEEVFRLEPRLVADLGHSATERRYAAFGSTRTGRTLAVVFTVRGSRIRVVTARDQSRRERRELAND